MNPITSPKEYLIDDEPVTWTELIKRGYALENHEGEDIKSTSQAAEILRRHGYKVGRNDKVEQSPPFEIN